MVLLALCLSLAGCLSTSRATAVALDDRQPAYVSEGCQSAIRSTGVHEDLYIGRMIASPLLLIATAGAAAPLVIGGNVALDAADRVDASTMSEACGGPGKTNGEIAADVATTAALGAATGAALDGVAGGGEGIASRLSRFLFGGATSSGAR
jgi:hypothetical protein